MRWQVQNKTEDTKESFLRAAFDFLVENGLENASVRDMCKAAGYSTGSVYYWFKGKEDLIISAVEFGLAEVVSGIFEFVQELKHDMKTFFTVSLDELSRYKLQFRLIYQVVTSPFYGDKIRNGAKDLNGTYKKYSDEIADSIGCPREDMEAIVYLYAAMVLDYAIWDDADVARKQMDFLYSVLESKMKGQK